MRPKGTETADTGNKLVRIKHMPSIYYLSIIGFISCICRNRHKYYMCMHVTHDRAKMFSKFWKFHSFSSTVTFRSKRDDTILAKIVYKNISLNSYGEHIAWNFVFIVLDFTVNRVLSQRLSHHIPNMHIQLENRQWKPFIPLLLLSNFSHKPLHYAESICFYRLQMAKSDWLNEQSACI